MVNAADFKTRLFSGFFLSFFLLHLLVFVLYINFADFDIVVDGERNIGTTTLNGENANAASLYTYNTHILLMLFVGFGFLTAYLRRYTQSAIAQTFMIAAFCIEWGIMVMAFWAQVEEDEFQEFDVAILDLVHGSYAATAVVISMGALMGKVNATQLLWLAFAEVMFYGLNNYVITLRMEAVDVGGSMSVHTFGAFFGLAASYVLSNNADAKQHKDNRASEIGDTFAFLGSAILFVLFPSWNAVLAPAGTSFRVIVNTLLGLCASSGAAYAFSYAYVDGHFAPFLLQNATIAGGVAMGSNAAFVVKPGSAIAIGFVAGFVTIIGAAYISPWIEAKLGVTDTRRVMAVHGLPAMISAIASASAADTGGEDIFGQSRDEFFQKNDDDQPTVQILAYLVSIGIGAATGFFSALLVNMAVKPSDHQFYFNDTEMFEHPEEEKSQELTTV